MEKKWYKSWTLWFNVAVLMVTFITELGKIVPIPTEFLVAVTSIGNMLLRIRTVTGLKM